MRVLILGSSGMLGKCIFRKLKKKHKIFHNGIKKRKFPLSNLFKLKKLIIKSDPEVIINVSGYTDIEQCENNKIQSKKINADFIKSIFVYKKLLKKKFKFIQISTDQVYDAKKNEKNREAKKVIINNEYTKHKLLAEKICKKNKSIILRTNFFGKSETRKQSFSDWVIKSFKGNKIFFLVDDVYFSPLRMETISKIILQILKKKKLKKYGIFNLGSKNGISKKDFALKLASYLKIKKNFFQTKKINEICNTKRSRNMMMNVTKFEKTFKIMLPLIESEIKAESLNYE